MNLFDPAAMADFWRTSAQAVFDAQKNAMEQAMAQAGQVMKDGMKAAAEGKLPPMPDLSVGTGDLERTAQSFAEMWSAASTLFTSLAGRFPAGDGTAAETMAGILHPARWLAGTGEMDDVLARMAEGPRLADLWDTERRFARVARSWLEMRRATLEHQTVVLGAWTRASRRFADEVADRSAGEGTALDPKAALALWTGIANRELLQAQRSEAFLRTQAGTIRASTELRVAQTELVEFYGRQYGFPTRTELDDVHRTVTELRRELRILKRRTDRAERAASQAGPAAVPASAAAFAPAPVPPPIVAPARSSDPIPLRRDGKKKR